MPYLYIKPRRTLAKKDKAGAPVSSNKYCHWNNMHTFFNSKNVGVGDRGQQTETNKDTVRLTLILTSGAKPLDELGTGYSADSYIAVSAVLPSCRKHTRSGLQDQGTDIVQFYPRVPQSISTSTPAFLSVFFLELLSKGVCFFVAVLGDTSGCRIIQSFFSSLEISRYRHFYSCL